jgi:hypothetical protein
MRYLIFIILIALPACHSSSNEPDKNLDKPDSTFKVVKDIPVDKNGKYLYFYELNNIYEKNLALASIENGFDSLEIRISYGVALLYEGQTIILRKNNSGWTGKLYYVKYNGYRMHDSLFSLTSKEKDVTPKSGWNNLMNKLYSSNIMTLKDASEIENYSGSCNDGDGVLIEIATKNNYRIYQYPCLSLVLKDQDIWQAKNIEKILETLEDEFNFKRVY